MAEILPHPAPVQRELRDITKALAKRAEAVGQIALHLAADPCAQSSWAAALALGMERIMLDELVQDLGHLEVRK